VAYAIATQIREPGIMTAVVPHPDPEIVRLKGLTFDVSILTSDWEKIIPYLQDGSFSPYLYSEGGSYKVLHPEVQTSTTEDFLYQRILGILKMLFTEEYPISNL
jgi:hypothetical protein